MEKQKLILGIDLGGTNTKFGLMDEDGEFVYDGSIPTNLGDTFDNFIVELEAAVSRKRLGKYKEIAAIGVGAPKGNLKTGCIEEAFNLIAWGDEIPIAEKLEQVFEVPTFLLNDANAAAYGEKSHGVGKNYDDFIFITLGTGLGSGFFVNGDLLVGKNAAGGELGHVTVDPNGRYCKCGRQGCLETYASAEGLKKTMRHIRDWKLGEVEEELMTGEDIAKAAKSGDPLALKAFDYTGEVLGKALANVAAIFDPEAIIFGGGLAKADALFLDPVVKEFRKVTLGNYLHDIDFLISNHNHSNMGVLGAASYAVNQMQITEKSVA